MRLIGKVIKVYKMNKFKGKNFIFELFIIHEYMKIATFLLLYIDNYRKWEYSNDVVSFG